MRPSVPGSALGTLQRFRDSLPRGKTLPADVWQRRHRAMVTIVWLHVVGLTIFGLAQGYPLWHVGIDVFPIVTFGVAAGMKRRSLRFRACMVGMGLLSSSAVLVHQAHGSTEAHFHF